MAHIFVARVCRRMPHYSKTAYKYVSVVISEIAIVSLLILSNISFPVGLSYDTSSEGFFPNFMILLPIKTSQ